MSVLGIDALGRQALGELSETVPPQPFAADWSQGVRRKGMAVAIAATTLAGFVSPPKSAPPVFSKFSEPVRESVRTAAAKQQSWLGSASEAKQPTAVFNGFDQPFTTRYSVAQHAEQGWVALPGEAPAPEPEVAPGGGTSRRLKKTGFEPVRKTFRPAEVKKPAPVWTPPPELLKPAPKRSAPKPPPFEAVNPAELLGTMQQMRAAEEISAANRARQDEQDIADIAAFLKSLD